MSKKITKNQLTVIFLKLLLKIDLFEVTEDPFLDVEDKGKIKTKLYKLWLPVKYTPCHSTLGVIKHTERQGTN